MADEDAIYEGLLALLESEFPKTCPKCGRVYETMEAFVDGTSQVRKGSGLMGYDTAADGLQQVVMMRNCACGSTMGTFCSDRRDHTDAGLRRRRMFNNLLTQLKDRGVDALNARSELLMFLRGERSEVLESLGIFARPRSLQPQS
jgi:hypothetical protein